MSERSIPEILGWTHVGYDDWVGLEWYSRPGEEQVQPSTEPTVDDLLAWLAVDSFFQVEVMFAEGEWTVYFVNTDSGLDGQGFSAPTMLAALEAAVLGVDSAGEQVVDVGVGELTE